MENDFNKWTRKDFQKLRMRDWHKDIGKFDSFIIMPTARNHDSGFKSMEFVAVKENSPICRMGGHSDVIHFNGIGGYGEHWLVKYGKCPDMVPVTSWNIDCLKTSRLLRVFGGILTVGTCLSSFELYSTRDK